MKTKTITKTGEKMKIKIHPTALVGLKQIIEMFESKDATKNKDDLISINFTKAKNYISPISVEILSHIPLKTLIMEEKS